MLVTEEEESFPEIKAFALLERLSQLDRDGRDLLKILF
jgi:hypothetical protein